MAAIAELRERSGELFTRLLDAQAAPPEPAAGERRGFAPEPAAAPFSWFDPEQAGEAAALSFQLAALAATGYDAPSGLMATLERVEEEALQSDPEKVRQGFALFVTHNERGRLLSKPRTVSAAPQLFTPPRQSADELRRISIGGKSPSLDYWREDPLASEHHQHWHEVYPFAGLPPRDFRQWVEERQPAELVAILTALDNSRDWESLVASSSAQELARLFGEAAGIPQVRGLPKHLYRLMFRLNDRQGELFFYMHQQMLARYDAELLSAGLDRVEAFGPDTWEDPIAAGYDPEEDTRFGRRESDRALPPEAVSRLAMAHTRLSDAVAAGELRGANGDAVPIDRTTLGEAAEATIHQLHDLDPQAYPGLHNFGHGLLAELSTARPGVMASTLAAIRDQVFWRWHKCIDDLSASWQERLDPYEFDDAPDVLLRNSLDPADAGTAWASPDIILCRTADLPDGRDPQQVGEELFGGDSWSEDAGAAEGDGPQPVDELLTTMESVNFGGRAIPYLTHEPFSYFLRVENRASEELELTARIFLAPVAHAKDRRAWIEMDKFLFTLEPESRRVVHRADEESAVVKRPVDLSPAAAVAPDGNGDEGSYCDCGWPYTLLLPRGDAAGAEHRLLVIVTDAKIDRVEAPAQCGSMSWCGAVDRYPDTRDMGYPFCRPFGEGPNALRDAFVALPSAAARTVSIRHA